MKRLFIFFILSAMVLITCGCSPAVNTSDKNDSSQSSSPANDPASTDDTETPEMDSSETDSSETDSPKTDSSDTNVSEAAPQPGFFTKDGTSYYQKADGSLQTGWLELEGKRYYFQPDGCMSRGEIIINGRSHFFTATGEEIIIANPWNAIRDDYVPDLVEAENGYRVDRNCVDSLLQMLRDCRTAGYDAQITSAYRDHETQVYLYERKVNYYLGLGYAEADARREAGTVVAVPGTSEHELGLAVDLVDSSYWVLDEAQEHTPAQQWLMAHAWEYGFILRYPSDKSSYTGIIYEPWHYRYVGTDLARILHESGLCLEEYLNTLS